MSYRRASAIAGAVAILEGVCGAQTVPLFGAEASMSADLAASAFADVNADGSLDIVGYSGCQLALTSGGFGPTFPYPNSMGLICAGDVNGDGFPDLIGKVDTGIGYPYGTFAKQLGDGAGQFTYGGLIGSVQGFATYAKLSDFNSDGRLDLLVSSHKLVSVWVLGDAWNSIFTGDGLGAFTKTYENPVNRLALDTGDFNADGFLDWASGFWDNDFIGVHFGDGAGGSPASVTWYAGQFGANDIRIADFDGDGLGELAVGYHDIYPSGPDPPALAVFSNSGTYQIWHPSTFTGRISVADLNGDGLPDFVGGLLFGGSTLALLVNQGGGSLLNLTSGPGADAPNFFDVADANGDGLPDFIWSFSSTGVAWTKFLPNVTFLPAPAVPWIRSIDPWGAPVAASPAPTLTLRASGFGSAPQVNIGGRTYGLGSVQPSADGNTVLVKLSPPPPAAGLADVRIFSPGGSSAAVKYPLRLAVAPVLLVEPALPLAGQPALIHFASPTPSDLALFVGSTCLSPSAIGPYVTFDIGGCGDLSLLPSPVAFDASGLSQLLVTVPAALHGTIHLQFCDVNVAALLAGDLPLAVSNVVTLNIP